jgi:hypothetical protein
MTQIEIVNENGETIYLEEAEFNANYEPTEEGLNNFFYYFLFKLLIKSYHQITITIKLTLNMNLLHNYFIKNL